MRLLLLALSLGLAPCRAQTYTTLAGQPDPGDFVKRDGSGLTLLGTPMRFSGFDIGWLGVTPDGAPPKAPPDAYEIADVLATVQAMGGTVVRTGPAGSAGFATLDVVLKIARDLGLKVIVPLGGHAGDCASMPGDAICAALGNQAGRDPSAVFAADTARVRFIAASVAVLGHVNALNGIAYRDDPTIMAWENCLACARMADPAQAGAWSEQVGQALKAADPNHLYEDGAFAGRIGPGQSSAGAAAFATASVDIVGDALTVGHDPAAARAWLAGSAAAAATAERAYVVDDAGWTPAYWKTDDDLAAWLLAASRQRSLSGMLFGRLVGHAAVGGYMPAPPADPASGVAALYFPGVKTADMDAATMQERGRALRRFAFQMADISMAPAYLLCPPPEIIGVAGGRVTWRGAAGAASYTIERSTDPTAPGTWEAVCDACATDAAGGWQDLKPLAGPAWYRVMPLNVNGHKSVPSQPVQSMPPR